MIPNVGNRIAVADFIELTLTLKLYSNDKTPAKGDTAASYTAVSGGGYADKTLTPASWTLVTADPCTATYAAQDFEFTGPTSSPSVLYGYFIVDSNGVLRSAVRFSDAVVPFTPVDGSLIRITPKFTAG